MRKPSLPPGLAARLRLLTFILLPLLLQLQLPARAASTEPTPEPTPEPALTLDRALDLATSRSFVLSAARREVEAAAGAAEQAGARRNPALFLGVEDTRRASRTTTATLDWPLELGEKRALRVSAAERARELSQVELNHARAQVRASVVAAYFDVLIARERARLAADAAALTASSVEIAAKRVAAGKVSPVDATRARVDQANAQLEAAEAGAELATARQALALLCGNEVWGEDGGREAEPASAVGDTAEVPERPGLPELVRQLEDGPDLLVARAELERRRALAALEAGRSAPDLTLSVGAKRDNEIGRTQATLAVSIPLPLFDRNQGAIREAARRVDKADDDHRAARLRLRAELQAAAARLAVAQATLAALRSTVLPAAQQAQEAARRGYDAGKFGLLDVIDAQRALLNARTRQLGALASAYQAATTIDRLLGR